VIKAIVATRSGNIVALGLSLMNLRKLQNQQPIVFDLADLGLPPQQVMIFYGATEEIMETELHRAFDKPKTPT